MTSGTPPWSATRTLPGARPGPSTGLATRSPGGGRPHAPLLAGESTATGPLRPGTTGDLRPVNQLSSTASITDTSPTTRGTTQDIGRASSNLPAQC